MAKLLWNHFLFKGFTLSSLGVEFTMNSLSNRELIINSVSVQKFTTYYANTQWIHYFANILWIYYLFGELTSISEINHQFTIDSANLLWIRFVYCDYTLDSLLIHLVFQEFTINLLVVLRFTLNLPSSRINYDFTLFIAD